MPDITPKRGFYTDTNDGPIDIEKVYDAIRILDNFIDDGDQRLTDARQPVDGSVTRLKLAEDVENILAAAVSAVEGTIGTGAVTTIKLADAAVTTLKLFDGAVTTAKLGDASVTNAKVSGSAAIAESKLALASDAVPGTPSRRTLGTGPNQALPGDHASTTDTRVPTDASVTLAKFSATGTPDATKYLRGDNSWVNPDFVSTTTLLAQFTEGQIVEAVSDVYPSVTRVEDQRVLFVGRYRPSVTGARTGARPGDVWTSSRTSGGIRTLLPSNRWSPRKTFFQPFSNDSPFNTPIGLSATFEASTDAATAKLLSLVSGSRTVNWNTFSIPVFWGSYTDPVYTVTTTQIVGLPLRFATPLQLYVPINAAPASGSDGTLILISPDGKYSYEFNQASINHATTGAGARTITNTSPVRITNLDSRGIAGARKAGIRASGFSCLGGLIRKEELKEKYIPHALVVALANSQLKPSGFVWPANSEDADSGSTYTGGASAVGMGTFCAIPASVDVTTLGLTAEGLAMARAAQDYGVYVGDRSGSVMTFYAETGITDGTAIGNLRTDVSAIIDQLRICTNSSSTAIGGPGVRKVGPMPNLVKMHISPEDSPENVAIFEDNFGSTVDERGLALTGFLSPSKWMMASATDAPNNIAFVDANLGAVFRIPASETRSTRLASRVSPIGQFGTDFDATFEGIRTNNVTTTGTGFAFSSNGNSTFSSSNYYQDTCYLFQLSFTAHVFNFWKITAGSFSSALISVSLPTTVTTDSHNLRIRKVGTLVQVWYRRNKDDWALLGSTTLTSPLGTMDMGVAGTIGAVSVGIDVMLDRVRIADVKAPMTEELTPLSGRLAPDKALLVANSVQKDETPYDLGSSGTAFTVPDPLSTGTVFTISVNANTAPTLPVPKKGRSFSMMVTNTGAFTFTQPANVFAPGGTQPVLTSGAGKVDLYTYVCVDGFNYVVTALQDIR